jgi:hypothetical protein
MEALKKEIKEIYNLSMGNLMDRYAVKHKRFFTQKEFEDNQGKILLLTHSKSKLDSIAKNIK